MKKKELKEKAESSFRAWENYYSTQKERQIYPDENLVRVIQNVPRGPALDLGCGKGRHLKLLKESGFDPIYASDLSPSSLAFCKKEYPFVDFFSLSLDDCLSPSFQLSLPSDSLQLVIAWGVLHYNPPAIIQRMIAEIKRVLFSVSGVFTGTLRAERDTHLQKNHHVGESYHRFYTQEECSGLLAGCFPSIQLGYNERSPIGNLEERIAHWIFYAETSIR